MQPGGDPNPPPRGWFSAGVPLKQHEARWQWFGDKEVRAETVVGDVMKIGADFSNGFIDFGDLTLRIPGALCLPFIKPSDYALQFSLFLT